MPSYEELSLMNGKCQASEKRVKSLTALISAANWQSCKLFLTGSLALGYGYAKRHVGNVAAIFCQNHQPCPIHSDIIYDLHFSFFVNLVLWSNRAH